MIAIQFPNHPFKTKQTDNKDFVFDEVRKQWLLLTPEEWVRQNFIQYLIQILHYPKTLIAIEKEIVVNELKKRFDIVVYSNKAQPWMLVECKAMNVPVNKSVVEQALRYNQKLGAVFMVVTNGAFTHCFQLQPQVAEINMMPAWPA